MMARLVKYTTIVYPKNRHSGFGTDVVVYAATWQGAIDRAVEIGWSGSPEDARVLVKSVEDTPLTEDGA